MFIGTAPSEERVFPRLRISVRLDRETMPGPFDSNDAPKGPPQEVLDEFNAQLNEYMADWVRSLALDLGLSEERAEEPAQRELSKKGLVADAGESRKGESDV